jgi:hypothetical protein
MNYSSNQIGLTQATVYDISAADLAGANSGQRPDLLAKTQAIFRTPDQKLYAANAARNQLVAAAVPVTMNTDPLTGGGLKVNDVTIPLGKVAAGSMALLGDSRNDQQSNGVVTYGNIGRNRTAVHWFNWYNALNNQPVTLHSKYAVSGSLTSALDGQITSMVALGNLPQFAAIWSGVNDLAAGGTALDAFTNLNAACARLISMGITPIVFTDPGATSLNTSARLTQLFEYNERIRNLGESNRSVLVFDTTSVLWDGSAASWTTTPAPSFKTGYSFDGTHLINLGGYNLGVAFGTWFAGRVLPFEARSSCVGEMVNANNPLAYIANGMFTTTTGGTQTGTGSLTGNVPASWTYNKGANAGTATTISTAANANGFGNDLTLAITTTVADSIRLTQDVATGVRTGTAIGSILQAGYELEVTGGTNLQGINIVHEYNDGSTSYTHFDMYCQNTNAGNGPQAYTIQGQTASLPITTAPNGWITSRIECVFSGAGGATVKVRRARMRRKFSI